MRDVEHEWCLSVCRLHINFVWGRKGFVGTDGFRPNGPYTFGVEFWVSPVPTPIDEIPF